MAHHHHRHFAAEHPAHFGGPVAGCVDDIFATDFPLLGDHHPFVAFAAHAGDRTEADDPGAVVAGALCQGLGELGGIDVAVIRVVERALKFVRLDERVACLDLVGADDLDRHTLVAAHAFGALEFLHALLAVGQPDRTGDVVVHRVVDFRRQSPVKLGRIALHVHQRPG